MTQENDSVTLPDQASGKAAAPAKKTGVTAKKTTTRKTAPQKNTTKAPAATGEETPAKTARATAKSRAGAKAPAKVATAVKDADGETAKTPARKAPAKPRRAAGPKTAPKAATPVAIGEGSAAMADAPATTLETPAVTADAPAGKAPGRKAAKPRRAASPSRTTTPPMTVTAPPAIPTAIPAEPAAEERPEGKTEATAEAISAASPVVAAIADVPDTEKVQDAPARPASRRSRRGGRRRNKSRAAAVESAASVASPEAHAPQEEAEHAAPDRMRDEPAETSVEIDEETPARVGGSAKNTTKAAAKGKKETPKPEEKIPDGKRKMFISVLSGELVEVVLAEEGAVLEYYVEMQHQAKVKGNIYKGVVSNIDANLQAAFISYAGGVKNGFLQVDEVHPEYYVSHQEPLKGRKFPPIQKILKPGQEILVQVVKEPSGTKGAFLTSYLSLPGRFLVLTPGREQIGVSRKVDNDEERTRLRGLLEGLKPGPGLGVIVRTVSTGASKTSLQRDLQFLKRLWKDVRAKGQTSPAPGLIYEELDLSTRAVRDYLTEDVQEVWVDEVATADQVTELATLLFPKKQDLVHLHHDSGQSLFERFSLQKQLDQIHSREVSLPSGGSLVIDKTEALTAIDINSGRSGGKTNFEDMAYRTNMEAAKAIPLQLRLRDIGGQIVADFIEMRDRDHWREVEKTVRNGMKGDRARYDVGKIGPFGMLEIVRQRLGSSAISISTEPCPCCKGTGIRRNMEWQAMQALRDISKQLRQAVANSQAAMTCHLETELAFYLLNAKRTILQSLENESGVALTLAPKTE